MFSTCETQGGEGVFPKSLGQQEAQPGFQPRFGGSESMTAIATTAQSPLSLEMKLCIRSTLYSLKAWQLNCYELFLGKSDP